MQKEVERRAKGARRSLAAATKAVKTAETKLRKARARAEHWRKRVAYYEGKGL